MASKKCGNADLFSRVLGWHGDCSKRIKTAFSISDLHLTITYSLKLQSGQRKGPPKRALGIPIVCRPRLIERGVRAGPVSPDPL